MTVSCAAVRNREKYAEVVTHTRGKDYDKAIEAVNHKDFYDEKSALLKRLDLGNLYYLKGNYYQALQQFDRAKEISDELYTVSISRKVASAVSDDTADMYYGEKFEISMIRFYASLCHYHLYAQGYYEEYKEPVEDADKKITLRIVPKRELSDSERQRHLEAARSTVVEWASFLRTARDEEAGKVIYKDDVLSKVYAAMIHEAYGTRRDREVALGLYKEALETLFTNYNMYPTYNRKYEDFIRDYAKLPNMPRNVVEAAYVDPTEASVTLKAFLQTQIAGLSQKKEGNVKILLKSALITNKAVEEVKIPVALEWFTINSVETDFFGAFVARILTDSSIRFEMPVLLPSTPAEPYTLKVEDTAGKEIKTETLVVLSPLSDIAYRTFLDKKTAIRAKIVSRAMVKYTAAIIGSYAIYKQNEGSGTGFLLALISYKAAEAIIRENERADVRYWGTLTETIRVASVSLKKGEYVLKIYDKEKMLHQEKLTVLSDGTKIVDINL